MTDADVILDHSNRFQTFRKELIQIIPRIPNNKESLKCLKSKGHTDLLIIYICWRLRHIGIRRRTVIGRSRLADNPHADTLQPNIEAFISAVETGLDLEPYLSRKAHRQGYVLKTDPKKTGRATWGDKDFLLNATGFHHFHLGLHRESRGFMARTEHVLFAYVSRDTLEILGLFEHTVFDDWRTDEVMPPERRRIWSVYEEHQTANNLPGQLTIGGLGNRGITTAGTPVVATQVAICQIRMIREIEPKLDDSDFVRTLFRKHTMPEELNLKWHYEHLDFGLLNRPSNQFILLIPGPN